MATAYKNLSDYDPSQIPDVSEMRFGIVISEWNKEITEKLKEGAYNTLVKHGAKPENITVCYVPGSFELIYGARLLADNIQPDVVIGLGCVVRGETPHFDYVCSGVTQGFAELNTKGTIPFIFGLLTNDTMKQSVDRAGGIYGNKGDEAAITAIKMVQLSCSFK
ncbi:6,7-dimethyl-8-ribityllumazine synthase [Bacteroidia bacterium]|nr:6,7-dimethyl-8-ribityllumazine synthase [Bacteroidia bacterium]GHV23461.1 6,7-dimethyl-8-ribityllumazine synthase [Bacteroidia bacterium]